MDIENKPPVNIKDFIKNISDKNINWLIGSGASAGAIPTLQTEIKLSDTKIATFEDLLTHKDIKDNQDLINFVYFIYFEKIVRLCFCNLEDSASNMEPTLKNYIQFIEKNINLIARQNSSGSKRINIFTTNYDLFIERASDEVQKKDLFILNDGSRGLINRLLSISNFHISSSHHGTTDIYQNKIPTINLIKMHGSVSWNKNCDGYIYVSYPDKDNQFRSITSIANYLHCSNQLNEIWENCKNIDDLKELDLEIHLFESHYVDLKEFLNEFIQEFTKIAIVNPTKEKFHETVFQQHYYQSLRLLSYELERDQVALICFGFSFQDEHIREIVIRSLSNPSLHVYYISYGPHLDVPKDIEGLIAKKRITVIKPCDDEVDLRIDLKQLNRILGNN